MLFLVIYCLLFLAYTPMLEVHAPACYINHKLFFFTYYSLCLIHIRVNFPLKTELNRLFQSE